MIQRRSGIMEIGRAIPSRGHFFLSSLKKAFYRSFFSPIILFSFGTLSRIAENFRIRRVWALKTADNAKLIIFIFCNSSTHVFFFLFYSPLDRERQSTYLFVIVATDSGKNEIRSSSMLVEIYIDDVNDNEPIFEDYPFRAQVRGSTQPGQNIMRIHATDTDDKANGEIVYSLSLKQDTFKFRIHPTTGIITATASFDQDIGQVYRLDVIATDRGNPPLHTRGLIILHVWDSIERAPILKFQNDSYEIVVQENSAVGTELIQLKAVRFDGRRKHILYSIVSSSSHQTFTIDRDSGVIKVNDPTRLDAEWWSYRWNSGTMLHVGKNQGNQEENLTNVMENEHMKESRKETFSLELTCIARTIDPDASEAYAKLIVRISDMNDNAPIFTRSHYSVALFEGNAKGDFVVQVSLTI